jgi:tRNA-specific 2-thiouridylase
MSQNRKEKILVAMSGGVDSAVSAMLLERDGHAVEGVYVRTWEHEDDLLGECPGAKDLRDAEEVCNQLKIPFRVVNYSNFYRREVVQPMVDGYADGITPNPDILCNKQMKFGILMNYAKEEGFDALATGHYCIQKLNKSNRVELWEGRDKNKDQSYFLARLSIEQLKFARFPVGSFQKSKIRKLAQSANLPVAEKKDSQGICFLGKVKVPDFLSHYIKENPGDIVNQSGDKVGEHLGLHRYTLGQRKGIGVPSNTDNQNYVVTGKDESTNQLIVAFDQPHESTLWAKRFGLIEITFIDPRFNHLENIELLGKARYRDPSTPIRLTIQSRQSGMVEFDSPQRALTPGQILAFYEGEQLVGSAIYSLSKFGRAALST